MNIENVDFDSDEEDLRNTIGNIPLEWYDDYNHIGYDLDGKKIARTHGISKDKLDNFIEKMEDPNFLNSVTDPQTGKQIILKPEDINIIKHLTGFKCSYNDNEEQKFSKAFMSDLLQTSLSGRPEHKRSFIPSKWEKLQVGKYVNAIKMGWIKPKKPKENEFNLKFYDLWGKEDSQIKISRHLHRLPAPKIELPNHQFSYNPPVEYLYDENENKKHLNFDNNNLEMTPIPKKYTSLRLVPSYDGFIKDQFNRCLDMYLCPRERKLKVRVNPDDLLPKLPKIHDLQPFPSQLSIVYKGHKSTILSLSVSANGQWLLSGSEDKTVKLWEISSGKCLKSLNFKEKISYVSWIPVKTLNLAAILSANVLTLLNPSLGDKLVSSSTDTMINDCKNNFERVKTEESNSYVIWKFLELEDNILYQFGYRIELIHLKALKHFAWHQKGDYFATVLDDKVSTESVFIHQLSKQKSIAPFNKLKGVVQLIKFHPLKPIIFIATQKNVKIYDLMQQSLLKKLYTNCQCISSMDIHNGGDNVIIGGHDGRVNWFDLDLSSKPYKSLKYLKNAVRSLAFHRTYPLFAAASDDGKVVIYHGMVFSDLVQNPEIIPLKILRGQEKQTSVTCCQFHPVQPWLFSAGTDGTIKLYSN